MVPRAECLDDLVELFQAEGIFERAKALEGCIDVMMLQRPDQVMVIGFWDDEAAYQSWLDHPERSKSNEEINALLKETLTPDAAGGLYDVALSTTTLSKEIS